VETEDTEVDLRELGVFPDPGNEGDISSSLQDAPAPSEEWLPGSLRGTEVRNNHPPSLEDSVLRLIVKIVELYVSTKLPSFEFHEYTAEMSKIIMQCGIMTWEDLYSAGMLTKEQYYASDDVIRLTCRLNQHFTLSQDNPYDEDSTSLTGITAATISTIHVLGCIYATFLCNCDENAFLLRMNTYNPIFDDNINKILLGVWRLHITSPECYEYHHEMFDEATGSKDLAVTKIVELGELHKKHNSSTKGMDDLIRYAQLEMKCILEERRLRRIEAEERDLALAETKARKDALEQECWIKQCEGEERVRAEKDTMDTYDKAEALRQGTNKHQGNLKPPPDQNAGTRTTSNIRSTLDVPTTQKAADVFYPARPPPDSPFAHHLSGRWMRVTSGMDPIWRNYSKPLLVDQLPVNLSYTLDTPKGKVEHWANKVLANIGYITKALQAEI
jgi:hypothetical protein